MGVSTPAEAALTIACPDPTGTQVYVDVVLSATGQREQGHIESSGAGTTLWANYDVQPGGSETKPMLVPGTGTITLTCINQFSQVVATKTVQTEAQGGGSSSGGSSSGGGGGSVTFSVVEGLGDARDEVFSSVAGWWPAAAVLLGVVIAFGLLIRRVRRVGRG